MRNKLDILAISIAALAVVLSLLYSGDVKINILENADYIALSDSRILIDDAISQAQLHSILEIIRTQPRLITNVTNTQEGPLVGHYTHEETRDIFRSTSTKIADDKMKQVSSSSSKKYSSSTNLKKATHVSHLIQVQTQIVDYAEAFFRKRLSIHSSLIFSRTRAQLTDAWEQSPSGLNDGNGWLVPIHVDSCSFEQHLWSCITLTDPATLVEHSIRDVSVVLFLDDVSEGGEFVFVDQLYKNVTQVSMDDYSEMLRNGTIPEPFVLRPQDDKKTNSGTKIEKKKKKGSSDGHSNLRQLLPPSRSDINRHIRRALRSSASSISAPPSQNNHSATLMMNDNKFVKHVVIPQNESSYTVVLPRSRRLTMFGSGRENVHAVMQIASPHVHRFTLFMFLSEEKF